MRELLLIAPLLQRERAIEVSAGLTIVPARLQPLFSSNRAARWLPMAQTSQVVSTPCPVSRVSASATSAAAAPVLVARAEAHDEAGLKRLKASLCRQLEASGVAMPGEMA